MWGLSFWCARRIPPRPTDSLGAVSGLDHRCRAGESALDASARPQTNRSALRELERAPRLGLAVFLALDHAAVAGEEAAVLEHAAQLGLEVGQRLGEAVAHRAGLAGQSTARYPAND